MVAVHAVSYLRIWRTNHNAIGIIMTFPLILHDRMCVRGSDPDPLDIARIYRQALEVHEKSAESPSREHFEVS